MNLAFILVKTASGVYTLIYRRNNVTSSRRRECMDNMTLWYLRLNVNIFVNNWISREMKTSSRSWKTRLFEYIKFRKSILYDLRALLLRRQSYCWWKPVNSRIIKARFFSRCVKTTKVQCYAPTDQASEKYKDPFNDVLQEKVYKAPAA